MTRGGGGSSASKAGGLKDGARRRCIGRELEASASALCTCAWVGTVRPPVSLDQLR